MRRQVILLAAQVVLLLSVVAAQTTVTRVDGTVTDNNGKPVPSATVKICQPGTAATSCVLATIYNEHTGTTTQINPFTADGFGRYTFYAPPGQYDYMFSGSGIVPLTQAWSTVPGTGTGGGGGGGTTLMGGFTWFSAAGCGITTSSSAYDLMPTGSATTVCVTGTNRTKGALRFPNSGTPAAQVTAVVPPWATSVSTDVRIVWQSSTVSGTATWQIGAVCNPANGSATDDAAFLNYYNPSSSAAGAAANAPVTLSAASVSLPAGCTPGAVVGFNIKRIDTVGTAANADLLGFGVQFH